MRAAILVRMLDARHSPGPHLYPWERLLAAVALASLITAQWHESRCRQGVCGDTGCSDLNGHKQCFPRVYGGNGCRDGCRTESGVGIHIVLGAGGHEILVALASGLVH